MSDLELNNKALMRFMDQKNYNEAKEYTDKVGHLLSRKRSLRGQSVGKSLRNNNEYSNSPDKSIGVFKDTLNMIPSDVYFGENINNNSRNHGHTLATITSPGPRKISITPPLSDYRF